LIKSIDDQAAPLEIFKGDLVKVSAFTPQAETSQLNQPELIPNFQLSCAGNVVRFSQPLNSKNNYIETFLLSKDLFCAITNISRHTDFEINIDGGNYMGFAIMFGTEMKFSGDEFNGKTNNPLTGLFYMPEGINQSIRSSNLYENHLVVIYFEKHKIETALGISKEDLPKLLMELSLGHSSSFEFKKLELPHSALASAYDLINSPMQAQFRYRQLLASANNVLLHFIRALVEPKKPLDIYSNRLAKAKKLLTGNLTTRYSLESLANEVGISRTKLIEEFKRQFGVTASEFQREVRLNESYRLVAQTNKSITFIAEETGFSSSNNFSTAFKKHFGVTPREVRKLEDGITCSGADLS
jgi:AraC-like DNA-binding protein